ncbi:MAG: hypothetical protein KDJ77_20020, partial [Rhodobiaceae bacterium]|nr:hypothetical protein [Rhodobiaceae bacterium]
MTTILDLEAGSSILNPTNFDFATEIENFTVNSRFRAELDSATLENGNVVLLIDRDGDDGNLRDIDFQILDKDGTTVAEGEIVSTRGKTFDGTVTALKGGGFVIAMSENDGDIDVRYQVFDENGQAVSGQNPFGTNFLSGSNNNNTPEIVALDDGGFIIFYGKDNGTEQLRGQRFDAEGNTVGDDFLVANENSKDISATALADGRIAVAFEANSGVIKTAIVTAGLTEVGTDGNDVFNGTDGEDDFIGGTGNDLFNSKGLGPDLFDGGDGFDTVSYADAPAGRSFFVGFQNTVTAEGAAPTFLVDGVDGPISTGAIRELRATDTLVSIEKVILG